MHKIPLLPVLQEKETYNSYFMSLVVFFHSLTNCNYISFPHVPCLWAQLKIPVKSPCGLFPRTFLVRSPLGGRAPGFYSLSHYQHAHSQALHHQRHCQTKWDTGMARAPCMRRFSQVSSIQGQEHSHLHCAGHCTYRKYIFTQKKKKSSYVLKFGDGYQRFEKCLSITKKNF